MYRQARETLNRNSLDFRVADRLIDRAIERDSAFAEAWAVKSVAASYRYWFFDDRSDSIVAVADESSRRALALVPGLAEGHWARGHYYYRTQLDYSRALEEVQLALEGWPGSGELENLAGDIARRKGDMRVAISHYEQAGRLSPRHAEYGNSIGETYLLVRDYPAAESALRRALELAPDHSTSYTSLAMLHVGASGDTAATRRVLAEAHDMGGYDQQAEFGLYDLEVMARKPVAALAVVDAEWKAGVTENQYRYLPHTLATGLALRLARDSAAARAAFDSARVELEGLVEDDPTEPRYRSALGITLAALGRPDEAIREGEEGLRLMPPEKEAYRGAWRLADLARIYAMSGRPDAAIDRLEQLLSIPSDSSAWWLRLEPAWDPLREHPRFKALVAR